MSVSSSSKAQDLNASPGSSLRPSSGSGEASIASQSKRSSSAGSHSTGDSAASRSASVAAPMERWQNINEIQDPFERQSDGAPTTRASADHGVRVVVKEDLSGTPEIGPEVKL